MKDAPLEFLQKIRRRLFDLDREFVRECLRYRREIKLIDQRGRILSDIPRKDEKVVEVQLTRRAMERLQKPGVVDNCAVKSYAVKWPGKTLLVSTPTDVLSTLLEKHDHASGVLLSNGKIHMKVNGRNYVRPVQDCIDILLKLMPDVKVDEANVNSPRISHNAKAVGPSSRAARLGKRVSV